MQANSQRHCACPEIRNNPGHCVQGSNLPEHSNRLSQPIRALRVAESSERRQGNHNQSGYFDRIPNEYLYADRTHRVDVHPAADSLTEKIPLLF